MADDKLPKRSEDFSAWYNEIVSRAELAEYSPVRGCMVIRPNGYGIWERMQRALDDMFKDDRAPERVLPAVHPRELPHEGSGARRRLRAGAGGRDARRRQEARRAARRSSHVRDDHLLDVREVGAELPRSADADEPVGERRPLGDAHAPVPAHDGIPLAGGPHRARDRRGGRRGGAPDARRVSRLHGRIHGDAGHHGLKTEASDSPARCAPIRAKR